MSTLLAPLAPGEELIDAESFQRLHCVVSGEAGWRAIPIELERRAAPTALPDFEACRSRRDAERLAVLRARPHCRAAAVFVARRGGIQAVCCEPAPERAPGPIYWTSRPHALAAVLERLRPWRGAPAHDPLTSRILRSLGRLGVREMALLPLPVREQPTGFLYADAGDGTFESADFAALGAIAERLARAWERMIAERAHCGSR